MTPEQLIAALRAELDEQLRPSQRRYGKGDSFELETVGGEPIVLDLRKLAEGLTFRAKMLDEVQGIVDAALHDMVKAVRAQIPVSLMSDDELRKRLGP